MTGRRRSAAATGETGRAGGAPFPAFGAAVFELGGAGAAPERRAAPAGVAAQPALPPGAARVLRAFAYRGIRLGALAGPGALSEAAVRAALGEEASALLEVVAGTGAAPAGPASVRDVLEVLGAAPEDAVVVGSSGAAREAAAVVGAEFVFAEPGQRIDRVLMRSLSARLGPFAAARLLVGPLDGPAAAAADERQRQLTKPPGSLGRLEALGTQLAAIAGTAPPPLPAPAAVAVFAADHGVLAQGVSPWPQEVTAQMVANFCAGGAAINVLARAAGASLTVVDVGVATPIPHATAAPGGPVLLERKVRPGTADLSRGPAMSEADALAALDIGAEVALGAADAGAGVLLTGDMGIGNTTASAALIAALTGEPAVAVTGRGTGIDDPTLVLKTQVVAEAVARAGDASAPLQTLAALGGLEHAALAGYIVAAAAAGLPVIVDGVIAVAALLVAEALVPGVKASAVAGHRSAEPGAAVALAHLELEPLLDLGLRLGEGTGAVLALPLVQAAALVLGEMATFAAAGVGEAE